MTTKTLLLALLSNALRNVLSNALRNVLLKSNALRNVSTQK